MILDTLDQSHRYASLAPGFAKAFEFLKKFDGRQPDGTYKLDGDNVYAMVQRYTTYPAAQGAFEAHRAYTDVHLVFAGRETILWAPLATIEKNVTQPYAEKDDAALYALVDTATPLRMGPGQFAILFPTDGHVPGAQWDGPDKVTKVVVKIRAA